VYALQTQEFYLVPFPQVFFLYFMRLLHVLFKKVKKLTRSDPFLEQVYHFFFGNRPHNQFLKVVVFMFDLNERLENRLDHSVVVRIGGLDLSVDFEIGFDDDFALETALFVETGPFAVKGKMMKVIADDELALIDSFE
jgi:hypothetical protein